MSVRIAVFSTQYYESGENKVFTAKNRTSCVISPMKFIVKFFAVNFFKICGILRFVNFLFPPLTIGRGELSDLTAKIC